VVFKCTVTKAKTISVQTGTIQAGAIVYGSAQTVGTSPFTVGPQEGSSLTPPNPDFPFRHIVSDPKTGLMTLPWQKSLQFVGVNQGASSAVLQKLPTPNLTAGGFDKVASTGQPTMQALPGQTTLSVESANASVIITLNPATNTVDLASVGAWIPLVDGSEPPNFITDGAGHLILVAYP
jgi:hypothetical protein